MAAELQPRESAGTGPHAAGIGDQQAQRAMPTRRNVEGLGVYREACGAWDEKASQDLNTRKRINKVVTSNETGHGSGATPVFSLWSSGLRSGLPTAKDHLCNVIDSVLNTELVHNAGGRLKWVIFIAHFLDTFLALVWFRMARSLLLRTLNPRSRLRGRHLDSEMFSLCWHVQTTGDGLRLIVAIAPESV